MPPQSDPSAPVVLEGAGHARPFPDQAWPVAPDGRRGEGRRWRLARRCAQGETIGVVGESGSGKTTLGLAVLRLIRSQGPIVYLGQRIDGLSFKAMRPVARATCRSCFRTLTARCRRGCRSPTSLPKG